ncbi:C3HC4 type (RING finger) domain-containing protein [Hexamita inflata]|uniref:C3HC4 type (RING finger) domain-containing protein n=1 Tax=Hexamita inflata TaxID=28002 RepID=A0AA86UWQ3_9EUKA|nr:C3HC4 type (RING finger) domain-containing protein [Hexamita inflata]
MILQTEFLVPTCAVAITSSVFVALFVKFGSIGDFFIVIEHYTYTKILTYVLMFALFYLFCLFVRIFAFPGLSSAEMTQIYQKLNQTLANTYIRILQWLNVTDILQPKVITALLLSTSLAQLQIATQLFEARVNVIYGEQQQFEMLRGQQLRHKKRLVKRLYFEIIRPIILIPIVLCVTLILQSDTKGSLFAILKQHLQSSDLFMRSSLFVALHIGINYFKTVILLLINSVQILFYKDNQFGVNLVLTFCNAFFDFLETAVLTINSANTGLVAFRGIELSSIIDKFKNIMDDKFHMGHEEGQQGQNKEKPKDKKEDVPLEQRSRAQYLFFSDLLDLIDQLRETRKSLAKFVLALKSFKRMGKFEEPTLEDLYKTSDIEAIKKDLESFLEQAPCSICLSPMDIITEKNQCKKLNCQHCYHTGCIRQWIVQGNAKCPICNKEIFEGGEKLLLQLDDPIPDDNVIPDFGDHAVQQPDVPKLELPDVESSNEDHHEPVFTEEKIPPYQLDEQKVPKAEIKNEPEKKLEQKKELVNAVKEPVQPIQKQEPKKQPENLPEVQVAVQKQVQQIIQPEVQIMQEEVQQETKEEVFNLEESNEFKIEESEQNQFQLEESEEIKQEIQQEIIKEEQINQDPEPLQNTVFEYKQVEQIEEELMNELILEPIEIITKKPKTKKKTIQNLHSPFGQNKIKLGEIPIYTQQDVEHIDEALLMKEIKIQIKQYLDCFKSIREHRNNYALQRQIFEHINGTETEITVENSNKKEE